MGAQAQSSGKSRLCFAPRPRRYALQDRHSEAVPISKASETDQNQLAHPSSKGSQLVSTPNQFVGPIAGAKPKLPPFGLSFKALLSRGTQAKFANRFAKSKFLRPHTHTHMVVHMPLSKRNTSCKRARCISSDCWNSAIFVHPVLGPAAHKPPRTWPFSCCWTSCQVTLSMTLVD